MHWLFWAMVGAAAHTAEEQPLGRSRSGRDEGRRPFAIYARRSRGTGLAACAAINAFFFLLRVAGP